MIVDDAERKLREDALAIARNWLEHHDKVGALRKRLRSGGTDDFEGAVSIVVELLKAGDPGRLSIAADMIDGMFLLDEFMPVDFTESDLTVLIERAKTDFYAYQVLRYIDQQHPFSAKWKSMIDWRRACYLKIFLPPNRPPGPSRLRNIFRDRSIIGAIHALVEAGFAATRNRMGNKEGRSACDVVAKAIPTLSYAAIESIWANQDRLPKAGSFGNMFFEGIDRVLSGKIDGDHSV